MLMGHYAAALAGKAVAPQAPLWSFVLASQLLDVGWTVLIAAGVETARIDASLPGAPLHLEHMPWTHSLAATLIWAVVSAIAFGKLLKLQRRTAMLLGLVVLSHWFIDLLVHRPDLGLWFTGMKVGLGMWNLPAAEASLEMGLLAVAVVFWAGHLARTGGRLWPAGMFVALIAGIQIMSQIAPTPQSMTAVAMTNLVIYGVFTLMAFLIERRPTKIQHGIV